MPPAYGDINSQLRSTAAEDSRLTFRPHLSTTRSREMAKEKSVVRGILAGMAGGLAAAWVMTQFMASAGQTLQQGQSSVPKEDATMKAADAIALTTTGEHLSPAEEEKGG